jgi:hypothetical protein
MPSLQRALEKRPPTFYTRCLTSPMQIALDYSCQFRTIGIGKFCELWSAAALLPLFVSKELLLPKLQRHFPWRFAFNQNAKILQHSNFEQVLCFLLNPLKSTLVKPSISGDSKELTQSLNPLDATFTKNSGGTSFYSKVMLTVSNQNSVSGRLCSSPSEKSNLATELPVERSRSFPLRLPRFRLRVRSPRLYNVSLRGVRATIRSCLTPQTFFAN